MNQKLSHDCRTVGNSDISNLIRLVKDYGYCSKFALAGSL